MSKLKQQQQQHQQLRESFGKRQSREFFQTFMKFFGDLILCKKKVGVSPTSSISVSF